MRSTGLGSMPGTDFRQATGVVRDLSEELFAWPEVPARDEASAMIGRTLGLLAQATSRSPDGWRLSSSPDAAQLRAARWWGHDLDDFEELTQGYTGTIKLAVAGPWTLASQLRLAHPTMNHVIADRGACRDLAQALAEGIGAMAARVRSRLGHELIIQIDEPAAPAVLGGALPTFSGLHKYRTPDTDEVLAAWREVVAAAVLVDGVDQVWLHSCAPGLDIELVGRAGFNGLAVEAGQLDLDAAGQWLDAGRTLALGVAATDRPVVPGVDQLVGAALRPLRQLTIDAAMAEHQVVLTPACGLAGWPLADAARLLERLNQASELVSEQLGR